jgi:broad specificity phosphatase PhoE
MKDDLTVPDGDKGKASRNARLTLISHAATRAVREAAFPRDEPLEEREISRIVGLGWSAPRAQQVLAAPELRAEQTARALGLDARCISTLRDCDYGRWSGRELDAVYADEPDGVALWLTDPAAVPHDGESIVGLIDRIACWMDEQQETGHTIAITHPALIRSAIVHALNAPAQAFWRIEVGPLTLTDLRYNGSNWVVRSIACSLKL